MPATRLSLFVPLCVWWMLSGSTAGAENWPEFRGPSGNGHSLSTGLPLTWSEQENIVWKTPIHDRGWSSPVVWGNQIWMQTATEDGKKMYAVCLDRETGSVVHDLLLFENAQPKFCHSMNSYASPTPVIEEGRVYVHFGSYGTACLDTATGKVLWSRRDLECDHWRGPGSSPILFNSLLIVHYDGYDVQYVVAFDKETGKTVWKVDRNIDFGTTNGDIMKAYSTPIVIDVNGEKQLISPASKAVIAYDPHTGRELWRVRYGEFSATARPLYADGVLYVNSGFSKAQLYAIQPTGKGDLTNTHVEWSINKTVPSKPSQLLVDGLLYLIHDGGVASCVEAKTGEVIWQERVGGQYSASPLYANGKIYLFSHEGKVTVLQHGREFKVLAVNQLDEGFMASPAVTGNSLILRTTTHCYRIEVKS